MNKTLAIAAIIAGAALGVGVALSTETHHHHSPPPVAKTQSVAVNPIKAK